MLRTIAVSIVRFGDFLSKKRSGNAKAPLVRCRSIGRDLPGYQCVRPCSQLNTKGEGDVAAWFYAACRNA